MILVIVILILIIVVVIVYDSTSDCITDPNYGPDSQDYAMKNKNIWGQHIVRLSNCNNRIPLDELTLSDVRKKICLFNI